MGAEDGEVQQKLGAEVVIVRFYTLLDLICFSIQRNLKDKNPEYATVCETDDRNTSFLNHFYIGTVDFVLKNLLCSQVRSCSGERM